jgi:hypothetical protein
MPHGMVDLLGQVAVRVKRWALAATIASPTTRGTLDVLTLRDHPGSALLQTWERDDRGEHRVEAAIRLDATQLREICTVLAAIAKDAQ